MAKESDSSKGSPLSRLLLILINICFVAFGIFVIAYSIKLKNSGWLNIYEDLPWIQATLFAGMIALGCCVILIAAIGCIGASYKKRGLLCCYQIFVVLAFILVLLVLAGAVAGMYFADDWSQEPYPAAEGEPFVADGFNTVYCYAEAAYFCTAAPLAEVLDFFVPGQMPSLIESALPAIEGINDLCTQSDYILNKFIPDGQSKDVVAMACAECRQVEQYEKYESIYGWVDEQCPLLEAGTDVLQWCGNLVIDGTEGDAYIGAPYGACRPQFLGLWFETSKSAAIAMGAFLAFLVVVIISVCVVRRRRNNKVQERSTSNGKAGEDDSLEVVHGEFISKDATFQSDEEVVVQQQYGAIVY